MGYSSRLGGWAIPVVGGLFAVLASLSSAGSPPVSHAALDRASHAMRLGLSFEENRGQASPDVRYIARGHGSTAYFRAGEFTLTPNHRARRSSLKVGLVGASSPRAVTPLERTPGVVSYFQGNKPERWLTGLPTYRRLKLQGVYPGVDLVYYGSETGLEFDFVVAPGAAPAPIRLSYRGETPVRLGARGELQIGSGPTEFTQDPPVAYQTVAGRRQLVSCAYELAANGQVGFRLGDYDASRELVIDPVLRYGTYLGGSANDIGDAIAVDATGAAYVTGQSNSDDFPGTTTGDTDGGDVFVTKIDPTGSNRLYTAVLRSTDLAERPWAIAVDNAGRAYVTGETNALDYPTTPGAFQPSPSQFGNVLPLDSFVSCISPNGAELVYSTYLGGTGADIARGIAVDATGSAWVTGYTTGAGGVNLAPFPTFRPTQPSYGGGVADAFVVRLTPFGNALLFSTYLGGSGSETLLFSANESGRVSVSIDGLGQVHVSGGTDSADFPVKNAAQPNFGGGAGDGFLATYSADQQLLRATYLGGPGNDLASGVASDASGRVYVTGTTGGSGFPQLNPIQAAPVDPIPGATDAFLVAYNPNGMLALSSVVGGPDADYGGGVTATPDGIVTLVGTTSSESFPGVTVQRASTPPMPLPDAFVARVKRDRTGLAYLMYVGGGDEGVSAVEEGLGIAGLANGSVFITGYTLLPNFPTPSGFQPEHADVDSSPLNQDAFVARIDPTPPPAPDPVGANAKSGRLVVIGWSHTGVDLMSFTLERQAAGGAFQTLAHLPRDESGYIDTTVAPGVKYGYRVLANGEEGSSASIVAEVTPPGLALPDMKGSWIQSAVSVRGTGAQALSSITGKLRIRNLGSGSAGSFIVRVVASTNPLFEASDPLVQEFKVRSLGPNATLDLTVKKNLAKGIDARGRVLIAFTDRNQQVSEADESNNLAFSPVLR